MAIPTVPTPGTCILARKAIARCLNSTAKGPGNRFCQVCELLDPVQLEGLLRSLKDDPVVKDTIAHVRNDRLEQLAEATKQTVFPCANSNPSFEGAEFRMHLVKSTRRHKCVPLDFGFDAYHLCTVCIEELKPSVWWNLVVDDRTSEKISTARLTFPCVMIDYTYYSAPWRLKWVQDKPCVIGRPNDRPGQICTVCKANMLKQEDWIAYLYTD